MKTNYSIALRRFAPFFVLLALMCGLNQSSQAQISTYGFIFKGTGTLNASATNVIVSSWHCTACQAGAYPIGFTFQFSGDPTPYTTFYINSNGQMSLNGAPSSANSNNLASTGTFPVIAPFWQRT